MPTPHIRELLCLFHFCQCSFWFVHLIILIPVLLPRQFCKTKKQTTQTMSKFTGTSIVLLRLNNCHSCVCFAKYITDSLICLAHLAGNCCQLEEAVIKTSLWHYLNMRSYNVLLSLLDWWRFRRWQQNTHIHRRVNGGRGSGWSEEGIEFFDFYAERQTKINRQE